VRTAVPPVRFANFGFKRGTSVPLIPKFASECAARYCELRNRDTSGPTSRPNRGTEGAPSAVLVLRREGVKTLVAEQRAVSPNASKKHSDGTPSLGLRTRAGCACRQGRRGPLRRLHRVHPR